MSVDTLRAIAGCGRPWAAERANFAVMITEQYQGGGLDAGEYQELMRDLVRSDVLNAQADDQDLKNLLVSCVMIGAKLA